MPRKCGCGKQSSFGVCVGKPTHCGKCKTDDMENIMKRKCPCGKQPNFGFPGKKAVCCIACKEDGMNDVRNKKCTCGKQPKFGFLGGRAQCCSGCKEDGMVDIVGRKCPCGKRPSFGFTGEKATCCIDCKEDGMDNVNGKRCQGYGGTQCPTDYRLAPGREYCLACDPDDSRRLDKKRDEAAFFNFLDKHVIITQREFPVHYKCIDTDKTMAFIDGIIITKDVVVCLELDEDAHEAYDKGCEEARMHNVSAELKFAYQDCCIAWVRVNPHTKKNGKRDISKKALKIRDQRHQEALGIIEDILRNPRDCIEYVGY
jgi:hypothetical protein